jgi:hypothetical protein
MRAACIWLAHLFSELHFCEKGAVSKGTLTGGGLICHAYSCTDLVIGSVLLKYYHIHIIHTALHPAAVAVEERDGDVKQVLCKGAAAQLAHKPHLAVAVHAAGGALGRQVLSIAALRPKALLG